MKNLKSLIILAILLVHCNHTDSLNLTNRTLFKVENGGVGVIFEPDYMLVEDIGKIENIRFYIGKEENIGWMPTIDQVLNANNLIKETSLLFNDKIYNYQYLGFIENKQYLIYIICIAHLRGIEVIPIMCDDCEDEYFTFIYDVKTNEIIKGAS